MGPSLGEKASVLKALLGMGGGERMWGGWNRRPLGSVLIGSGRGAPTVPRVLFFPLPGVPPSTPWYLPHPGELPEAFTLLSREWQN